MEIISLLTSQLGVSDGQAKGGLGAILSFAQAQLSGADFSKIADLIEGADGLMDQAPKAEGLGGMLGNITSALGTGEGLGGLATLATQFKNLDLDSEMISKFAPIITGFLQEKGGDSISALISKILK